MRESKQAGARHPETEVGLRASIEEAFETGPGALPTRGEERTTIGALMPHMTAARPTAAWGYAAIAQSPKPDLFILLARNPRGTAGATSTESWRSPLGITRADQEFVRALASKGAIRLDDESIGADEAIESQLPFLQYLYGAEGVKIAPLLIGADVDAKQLAMDVKELLVDQGKEATLIAFTELTRNGPKYEMRFTIDPLSQMHEFDQRLLEPILARDAAALQALAEEERLTMSGLHALRVLLHALPSSEGRLEQYNIAADGKNALSFATACYERHA